jgi:hypothetical protein
MLYGDPCAMWNALEAVFREARLVEPRLTKDFWCQGLARLFAWWPQLFGLRPAVHGTPSVEPASLGGGLAPYIGITDDFMGIVVSLHQTCIGAATLDSAVSEAGQDLLRMIHRFLETARGIKDA